MMLIVADIIIAVCLLALFIAIMFNFAEGSHKKERKNKRSIVATGTMTLFFLAFYCIIRFKIGEIHIDEDFKTYLIIVGLLMIVLGTIINITGRLTLGNNWADHVKIYENQTFITSGMYRIVRHPLYASLMMMFYGACMVHPNYMAFLANTFIFIPFMYYRAKQEETLLLQVFEGYIQYKKEVGMFFPKLIK